ncbi:Di-heme cytochrome, transmembrane [Senna tora]|uniref:Di-heme cytochrome, transmembrane n=1 Tax=Senna tora TaxID=362788 RepID=A0A834SH68_9FABA|nr:Di-heme cytochrome, transmembrane [Senna tora]
MAMASASAASLTFRFQSPQLSSSSSFLAKPPSSLPLSPAAITTTVRPTLRCKYFPQAQAQAQEQEDKVELREKKNESLLFSFSPLPFLYLAALPGAGAVSSAFGPFVELVKSWNLPDWLVHWGHPANMAVVLFAMGGYGSYLGFRIRFADNVAEKAYAKDLHPKLLGGMFFFFALGATGGITSLLTSDKPIFESPHAVTAITGLALLTIQTISPALFEENPGLRNFHGILGSAIMVLFLVNAALGFQLGFSY